MEHKFQNLYFCQFIMDRISHHTNLNLQNQSHVHVINHISDHVSFTMPFPGLGRTSEEGCASRGTSGDSGTCFDSLPMNTPPKAFA